ncbi:UNC93-like protein [Lucilia sericata]|uniref:UNC93-like protein n=1 Tax=Lucilia sericata TaxID=13632 RepID=UPI0018A81473|nr:UNC93-like protein [Lucilia sericata]XP_037816006.1 UNC93-like protein [Lucilia sericata]XP_037816008.1 UNC93-like protein [Lucilia sericata]XP_037816009.1 UNC93-like protein [Lucilia sericata]XP_037816010.1 UNC93-like protein [Lucilia sericata]
MDAAAIDLTDRELVPLNGNGHTTNGNGHNTTLTNDTKSPSVEEAGVTTVSQYESRERFIITKNVIIIGLAFMIHFTAFHGTSNLQSSVNSDKALGTTTLAVIYGSLILSNIFLPMTVIRWFGVKITMALAFFAYMPYIVAQFYPRFKTLIPAGLMVGFGGGPLWCAKCTYLSTVAEALTQVRGQKSQKDVNTVKFFGLFFIFYQMAQVWGNLISSSVLSLASDDESAGISNNSSKAADLVSELCGARFCPNVKAEVNPNLIPPEPSKIQLLNSIFLVCMAVAVILIVFGVDSLTRYGMKKGNTGGDTEMSGLKLITATLKMLKKKRQLLMLPITMFIGLEEAFLAVDFTKSFVACGWGISNIGFAMICFGVANAIAAGFAGGVAEKLGRVKLAVLCALINLALFGYMFFYEAKQGDFIKYCAFAAIWGICDGVWLVVINAFYGILFPKNLIAGYSNFRLWESTGSVIGYIISSQLCTSTKLLILMTVLLVGCTGYGIIEYRVWKKQKYTVVMTMEKSEL